MASIINTNSLSLLTQNNLTKSQGSLNTAIERLSSGMRINSAKDDAAGQAIANRFTANIKGLTQASRNANDGISMAQTTEGALGEINTNLQRIRELAVQSSNGTNSDADRTSIQAEITQRLAEITRTSEQTDFNGTKVLNSNQALQIQVGANDKETISIDLKKMDLSALGLTGFNVDGTGTTNTAATLNDIKLAGFTISGAPVNGAQQYNKTTNNADATSANVFSKIATTGDTVTTALAVTTDLGAQSASKVFTFDSASNAFKYNTTGTANATVISTLKPGAGGSTAATVTVNSTPSQKILIDNSGNITAADDNAALFLTSDGSLSKVKATGATAQATITTLTTSMSGATPTGGTIVSNGTTYTAGTSSVFNITDAKISSSSLKSLANVAGYSATIQATAATATAGAETNGTFTVAAGSAASGGAVTTTYVNSSGALTGTQPAVESLFAQSNGVVTDGASNKVYSDSANAGKFTTNARSGNTATEKALEVLDKALSTVDALRGSLGAVQNRFDSVISNLGTTLTNLAASRSRIQDADYATEVSNMTRANILQQAGTSVLAQANQSTQGVLSLLR